MVTDQGRLENGRVNKNYIIYINFLSVVVRTCNGTLYSHFIFARALKNLNFVGQNKLHARNTICNPRTLFQVFCSLKPESISYLTYSCPLSTALVLLSSLRAW